MVSSCNLSWSPGERVQSKKCRNPVQMKLLCRSVTYTGDEDYLSTKTYFASSEVAGEQVEIPAGTHKYTFQCFLPIGTPTSFEGTHGHIRYTVKATLDRPWKFDQSSKVAFTVIRQVDLNYKSPSIRIPTQMEIVKKFCCWPCQSAPLIMTAQIPMSGYAPGQDIDISGELINKSNVHVHSIHITMSKTVTYFAERPSYRTKIETIKVAEVQTTGVAAGARTKFLKSLMIRSCAPTNLTQSKVIHQAYELIVEAVVSGCHKNPKIHMPILIGTVPLRQLPELPVATAPQLGSQPFLFPTPAAPPLDNNCQENKNFLELPPPSYEDCVMAGAIAIESTGENSISTNSFTPKYPVYNYGWKMN